MKFLKYIFILSLIAGGFTFYPTSAKAALIDNLVSYWKLDESSGNAADSHGSNTLTNTGVVFSAGKINNGADFELGDAPGSYDRLTITDASQSGLDITGDIALSAWVKPESEPGNSIQYHIAGKWFTTNSRSYIFRYEKVSGVLYLTFTPSPDGADAENLRVLVDLGTGTWKHIVMSWKASTKTLTVYVNGASVGTAVGSFNSIFSSTSIFYIGGESVGQNIFDGMIDEVGIWSRELTSTEVTSLYNGGSGCQYAFPTCESTATPSILGLVWAYIF